VFELSRFLNKDFIAEKSEHLSILSTTDILVKKICYSIAHSATQTWLTQYLNILK